MENLKLFFRRAQKKPLRFFLTILQISLGVLAAALIFNMHFGLVNMTDEAAQSLGEEYFSVEIYEEQIHDEMGWRSIGEHRLSTEALNTLLESPDIVSITSLQSSFMMIIQIENMLYQALGSYEATSSFADTIPLEFISGSFYTKLEEKEPKAVVSEALALTLFGTTDVVGKTIGIAHHRDTPAKDYLITGVFREPPLAITSMLGKIHLVHTPFSINSNESFHSFFVRANPQRVSSAKASISNLVLEECGPKATADIRDSKTTFDQFRQIIDNILKVLGVLAFFAVAVSSIGILSIMMVNILERDKEIGIRRSLGATQSAVFFQILLESMLISFLGGLLGLLLATIVTHLFDPATFFELLDIDFSLTQTGLDLKAALLSLLLACVVGGLFGIYPAYQGAKLSPVEALKE
ncbi:MAG TPA: ABC transporter permease [Firmicutes bacterium]|nr:ABC transporter permease [Bacillota bacterium]